jgi:hypothetical protein
LGDHLALGQFALLVAGFAVGVYADDGAGESASGLHIDFDAPLVMAFAKVEGVAVDYPAPLFRCESAVAVHDDSPLRR